MNKLSKITAAGLLVLTVVFLGGCAKETDIEPNDDNKTVVDPDLVASASTDQGDYEVKLFAGQKLFMGYNRLYLEVWDKNSNTKVEEARVSIEPLMNMGTTSHAAPFENPGSTSAVSGRFPCAVVFQMPGETGWILKVHVANLDSSRVGTAELSFEVVSPERVRSHVVKTANWPNSLIISMVEPQKPGVGINPFEITIHEKLSMMSFPAADSFTVEIKPDMPSMGHGSPNNVHPVLTGLGHYLGKVNFTMTGEWVVHLKIKKGSEVIVEDAPFEINLK